MFIEINVIENDNCPIVLNRIFDVLEKPKQVSKVRTYSFKEERECLCDVTGWSSDGPCPAYAVLVEDSGEGVAMLIYGGSRGEFGIRLRAENYQEPWDLNNPRQWGEACLLLDKDVELI